MPRPEESPEEAARTWPPSRSACLTLGLLIAVSAVLLSWNLDRGLPFSPLADETHCVPYTLPSGSNTVFEKFRYPGLAKLVYSVPRLLAGWSVDAPEIVLAARYLSVAFSMTALVLFFQLLRMLAPSADDWIALAGVGCLASHHLFVASARVALAESLLLCSLCGYFIALLRFHRGPNARNLVAAAMLLGLMTGAKYSGLFLYLPLVTSIAVKHRHQPHRLAHDAVIATSIFIAVFVATTPQLLVRPEQFIADFLWNNEHYSAGHPGQPTTGIAWRNLNALGLVTVSLGCLSMPLWWLKDRWSLVLFVPWAMIYFAKLGSYRMANDRNMLIVLPVLLISIAQVARSYALCPRRFRFGLALLVAALLIVPQWVLSSKRIEWQKRRTTLDLAYREINAFIPERASVWRSSYTPPVHVAKEFVSWSIDPQVIAGVEAGRMDYVVLSDNHIRWMQPGTFRYDENRELLRRLEAATELALHITANEEFKGAGVRVYRVRAAAAID